MAQRKRAGLITLRSLVQTQLRVFIHFGGFTEATSLLRQTLNTVTRNRCGAAGARRAHNSEDVGSKPTAGITTLRPFTEAGKTFHRYGAKASTRFTLGSEIQDQYLLPVF